MGIRLKIAVVALVLSVGCQELPNYFVGDTTLARVGRTELMRREVASVMPEGITGDDSTAFIDLYVDRWIKKQLKLKEAEKLFSSSEEDLDRLVEEYRQTLLIRKLDQFYVDRSVDTTFTDSEITAYYKEHQGDFRLDHTIVRGRIVRLPAESRQQKKLQELMGSPSAVRQQDFRDICVKSNFTLIDFSDAWVDYSEFLTFLPTVRSQSYDSALGTRSVQTMRDSGTVYLFQIAEVLRAGDPIPLEQVRQNIRRILFNRRQSETIRAHEQQLYQKASIEGDFRVYEHNKREK